MGDRCGSSASKSSYIHTHIRTYVHNYFLTYIRTCAIQYKPLYFIHTYIPLTYIHILPHAYIYSYIHTYCTYITYILTYIHTYIHTYIQTCPTHYQTANAPPITAAVNAKILPTIKDPSLVYDNYSSVEALLAKCRDIRYVCMYVVYVCMSMYVYE